MEKRIWTRQAIIELIHLWKQQKHLYDVTDRNYIDKVKRQTTLVEICNKMKKYDKTLTADRVRIKLHNLRNQYLKGYKKAKNNQGRYKLWCLNYLDFLLPYCKFNKSAVELESSQDPISSSTKNSTCSDEQNYSNFEEEPECDSEQAPDPISSSTKYSIFGDEQDYSYLGDEIECDSELTPKTETKNEYYMEQENVEVDGTTSSNCQQISLKTKDEKKYTWLGEQVVFEINKIKNEMLQEETAWAIQELLYKSVKKDRLQRQESRSLSHTNQSWTN